MDLIIVESPSKAKTISKYLKGKYKVDASAGHIRDLPEKTLGVDLKNNYEPKYVITDGKKDIIKRLMEESKKADKVYLATDPDREGEAISWHLQTVLKLDPNEKNRIEFNEISEKAVQKALTMPRLVNADLVDAQQARRVLDRLVGYKLSPLLNKRIHSGLSAGRVQSVALRLIVDRERAIQAFVPKEYWDLAVTLRDKEEKYASFVATLAKKKNKKYVPASKEEMDEVLSALKNGEYTVSNVKKAVAKSHAPAPFTTSTLQQDASNKFGLTSPEVMQIAQHLYEGIDTPEEGHIAFVTYIRTDSTRISAEAQAAALKFIAEKYGEDYVPAKPNIYAAGKGAQDAHEAIRPNDIARTPESVKHLLDRKHYNVYKLIYDRFVASQMAEAKYNTMQIAIDNGDYSFKASGRALLFAGFTAAYTEAKKDDEEEVGKLLPPLQEGDSLVCLKQEPKQKFTKPPLRYTDASLVKEMESNGIGRPSTYASIIAVLTKRKYVTKVDKKYMMPEPVAFEITDLLMGYFKDIMDVGFTAGMEQKLDEIEEGNKDWHKILTDFYPPFAEKVAKAQEEGTEETDIPCEKCGSLMVRKGGRYGKYLLCTNPECGNKKSETEVEVSDVPCPKCGAQLVVKSGKFGKFLACPNYPACKTTMPVPDKTIPTEAGVCPDCGEPVLPRKSKRGKLFYGCTGYPNCKFMSWDLPIGKKCPKCGEYLVKMPKGNIKCSNKECDYKEKKEETNED